MSVASKIQSDSFSDGRKKRHIYIDSKLDDLPLTMEAFRVYSHLCRRAGCDNNAFPSYRSIGESCFRGSFPNSPTDTLRRKAISAVNELICWNLVTKTSRENDGLQTSNAVASFEKSEQSNKPKQPKFQSIEDLIDMVLVDPSIMATDSLPTVYRTEIKMRNWRFPWRTATRDKIYQTCDRRLVELIAKHRAKWSESESWQEKIPTVLKSIGNLESSKAGLEELLGYWSQISEPEATSSPTKQQKPDEKQPIGYFANRSLDWHKSTFSEFLDRVDEVGKDKACASFSTRYDQQSPGATDKWLEWIKLTYPSMYLYLHQNAA